MKKLPKADFSLPESRIYIGSATELLPQLLPADQKRLYITDAVVQGHFGALMQEGPTLVIGRGERNKTVRSVERLYRQMVELGVDRSWEVVAIGGGLVCDVAGFAASTYMRGLKFGFVPTTLLSQVDASVGGKNGVNLDGYKNMVGTFTQPRFVVCDTALIKSLPMRQFRAGVAEIIKAALLADAPLFSRFESPETTIKRLRQDAMLLQEVVRRAIRVKVAIVERDEREKGERRLLNLGHTFGHAIEKCTRRYNHGEAVAIGMVQATEAAQRRGILSNEEAMRIRGVVEKMGLPTHNPIAYSELCAAMRHDKKGQGEKIAFVLPEAIGRCRIQEMTPEEGLNYPI